MAGALTALKRLERAFAKDDVAFLEQVDGQVAIAVENAVDEMGVVTALEPSPRHPETYHSRLTTQDVPIRGEKGAPSARLWLLN